MSRVDTLVSAGAWDGMVRDIKELGANPPEGQVLEIVVQAIWDTEGITLDEDHSDDRP